MNRLERGNQQITVGVEFTNISNLQKWYKNDFLGIYDLIFVQEFTAWNMSIVGIRYIRRGGMIRYNKLLKWEFCSEVDKQFVAYVYDDDKNAYFSDIPTRGISHKALSFNRTFGQRDPVCNIWSIEECTTR